MEISIPLTPPQAASNMSNVSPRSYLRSSPVKQSIKRKLGYDMTPEDMKRLRFDLPVEETDRSVLGMHNRHNAFREGDGGVETGYDCLQDQADCMGNGNGEGTSG